MAHIMSQATRVETPSHFESNDKRALHSFNFVGQSETASLQQEAFPGELAALRARVAQGKMINTPSPYYHHAIKPHQFKHEPLKRDDNLLADKLIEVMPTGLVMLDGNGIVVKINQVAKNLLDEPILGQPWFNVITRSFNPRDDDWHEISLKDGRRVKLEITSLGAQPGQLIMITDLTETRLLQDKLSQMKRLSSLGKMVSTLAHQIRTPLSSAILYSDNLMSNKLADNARMKFQDKLNARLHDLEQQVNDMLLFSKSGTEQVVAPINVHELITTTVHSMDALIDNANTKVQITSAENKLHILGNRNALTGALQNLIHNALQAFSTHKIEAPLINIQIYNQENHIYLSFKDNGPGIDLKIADKIFQPFYTSSSKGTGLGLAVVKSVVAAHQGEVSLLNENAKGAHFVIKLPLLEQSKIAESNLTGEES